MGRPSKARQQILKFAAMLDIRVTTLTWTPIGRGGEMQGPSGGWECGFLYRARCNSGDVITAYGLNADDLCQNILVEIRGADLDRCARVHHRLGVRSAAKEKDAEIADLKRRLASGQRADAEQAINEVKLAAIRELLRAVWKSRDGQPPMRENWVIEALLVRHYGRDWCHDDIYVAPDSPVEVKPLAEDERRKFHDGSPWRDLEKIRLAAGTQDTDAILAMLRSKP